MREKSKTQSKGGDSSLSRGNSSRSVELMKKRTDRSSPLSQSVSSADSAGDVSVPTLVRRVSTADLKEDMREHQEGRLGDDSKNTLGLLWQDPFKAAYWFIVFVGFLFFVYRNMNDGDTFTGRYLGEVGCIARQGNPVYTGLMIFFGTTQILSLVLLRKVKDEFAIRAELSYVTLASSMLIPIHLSMLFFAQNWSQKVLGFSGGCSKEFVGTRAAVSLSDKSCVLTIYAFWVSLILIAIIHTVSIAYPVGLQWHRGLRNCVKPP